MHTHAHAHAHARAHTHAHTPPPACVPQVSQAELCKGLIKLGIKHSPDERNMLWHALDSQASGRVSYQEFLRFVTQDYELAVEELRDSLRQLARQLGTVEALFDQFDWDRDGTISRSDLEEGLRSTRLKWSVDELKVMWEAVDVTGDGKVSYMDFWYFVMGLWHGPELFSAAPSLPCACVAAQKRARGLARTHGRGHCAAWRDYASPLDPVPPLTKPLTKRAVPPTVQRSGPLPTCRRMPPSALRAALPAGEDRTHSDNLVALGQQLQLGKLRKKIRRLADHSSMQEVFDAMFLDGRSNVGAAEFQKGLGRIGLTHTEPQRKLLWECLDRDRKPMRSRPASAVRTCC